jgi:PTS system nitrogen regulatory IIA component
MVESFMSREPDKPQQLAAFLTSERVLFLECDSKAAALNTLIDCLARTPQITDAAAFREAILSRESLMSTGLGLGIGVPHTRLESITAMVVAVGWCRQPLLDYVGLDGGPVELILMIAASPNQHAEYLRLLASVTARLKTDEFRRAVLTAENTEAAFRLLTC